MNAHSENRVRFLFCCRGTRIIYEADFSRGLPCNCDFLAVIAAIGLIVADSRLGTFVKIRNYMDTAVSPFYFLANGHVKFWTACQKRWPPANSWSWKTELCGRNCC